MFKQVKSALFWYYLYKFRRKVISIIFLLLIALFANSIYSDVVEYLTLKNRLEYLEIALLTKWSVIIFNILFSIYLFLGLFRNSKTEEENKREIIKNKDIIKNNKNKKFTKREEEFLQKELKSKADLLVER
ncbi:hypothetical protein [Halarcobacter ebronensis]|uniref:Uncharacterized protein n=1 Tax=Halarcobacter ebronensis TaxID=1462615 RepID=A0A4Q1AJZ9_9BACT|nr:hypothetical protein [Halarcobacter ebronensis]QKF81270.1 putative membrane protein [Halarcobacter ebronensis]RXK04836.1 hypothetical protein CRV07_09610 [Halarcobacter ebronensis]